MKGMRLTLGLIFALALTGLFLSFSSWFQAWQIALATTIIHIVLAFALLISVGPVLWKHTRGRSRFGRNALPLDIAMVGLLLSGVVLTAIGRRGHLALAHWSFGFLFVFALLRHAGAVRKFRVQINFALAFKVLIVTAVFFAVILIGRQSQSKTTPEAKGIPLTSIKLVGELPNYDKASMSPEGCAKCHARIVDEWKQSLHAVSDTEIVYARVVGEFRQNHGIEASNWCAGCHSPLRVARGQLSTKVADVEQPNVECITCHSVQHLGEPLGSNHYDLAVKNEVGYGVTMSLGMSNRLMLLQPAAHVARWNATVTQTPEFCGACHRQTLPEFLTNSKENITIQDTFGEWQKSRFNGENASERKTCQDCHMPESQGIRSVAGMGHPSHLFAGGSVDIAQLSGARTRLKVARDLLENTAAISLKVSGCDTAGVTLLVQVSNYGAGHNLPTGVSDLREVWLAVTVTDSDGKVVYQSGAIDDSGTLDPAAVKFGVTLGDENKQPVYLHDIVRARYILRDTTISAGETRDSTFNIPAQGLAKGQIAVKLLYRTVPQLFLNHHMTPDLRFQSITMAGSTLPFDIQSLQCTVADSGRG